MYLVDKVFIVLQVNNVGETDVKSVWTSLELAQSAKHYHSHSAKIPIDTYFVITRAVNEAKHD